MKEAKLSEYYKPEPFRVWKDSVSVKLADIVPAKITIKAIAKVEFEDSISFAYLTTAGEEFVTSSMKLSEIGRALIESENVDVDSEASRDHVLVYNLVKPVKMKIEKLTTAGGRSFYAVSDE